MTVDIFNGFSSGHATTKDKERLLQLEQRLVDNPRDYQAMLEKAILYYEPFHLSDAAVQLFTTLVEHDATNVDALFWFAECLFDHIGDYEKAENLLRRALALNPKRADCHYLLASVVEFTSASEEVMLLHAQKAVELEPSWIHPRLFLASLLLKKDDLVGAKRHATIAMDTIVHDIPVEEDSIKKHYERLITGRYYENNKKDCLNILEEIQQALGLV